MLKRLTGVLLALGLAAVAAAEDLPKRIWHGAAFTPNETGLVVNSLQTGGTGAAARLLVGDVVTAVNGIPTPSVDALNADPLRLLRTGELVVYTVRRGTRTRSLRAAAAGRLNETVPAGTAIEYGAVAFGGGLLRSAVTKPVVAGRHPAILFVQGYPCGSYIDINAAHPYRRMVDAWAQAGFVVMRVDKPGVGDSRGGTSCEDIDMKTEAAAFAAGLAALKARSDVNPGEVFIFGHSLGGISGPMIAEAGGVRGVAVYGITPAPWFEYYINLGRIQSWNAGANPLEVETSMRTLHPFIYGLMVQRKTPAQLVAETPSLGPIIRDTYQWDGGRRMFGRDVSLYWDLNEINQAQLWNDYTGRVLVLYGSADMEVMGRDGPRAIARMVNAANPGNARYCEFAGLNHSFAQMGSMDGEYTARAKPDYGTVVYANYSPGPADAVTAWIRETLSGGEAGMPVGAVCDAPTAEAATP
jgi:uncharacterized protein